MNNLIIAAVILLALAVALLYILSISRKGGVKNRNAYSAGLRACNGTACASSSNASVPSGAASMGATGGNGFGRSAMCSGGTCASSMGASNMGANPHGKGYRSHEDSLGNTTYPSSIKNTASAFLKSGGNIFAALPTGNSRNKSLEQVEFVNSIGSLDLGAINTPIRLANPNYTNALAPSVRTSRLMESKGWNKPIPAAATRGNRVSAIPTFRLNSSNSSSSSSSRRTTPWYNQSRPVGSSPRLNSRRPRRGNSQRINDLTRRGGHKNTVIRI